MVRIIDIHFVFALVRTNAMVQFRRLYVMAVADNGDFDMNSVGGWVVDDAGCGQCFADVFGIGIEFDAGPIDGRTMAVCHAENMDRLEILVSKNNIHCWSFHCCDSHN